MQKLISKYALAAHLAVMAVAPLFLLPFCGVSATFTVMLWLSAFGFVWVLMEPSRRRGEMLHDARARVSRAVLADPLFWFSVVLVGYAVVRACNAGIGLAYDAEHMVWSIRDPAFDLFPGCVDGFGDFSCASAVSLVVIFQGLRHALGRSARSSFLLVCSLLSSIAAIVLALAVSYRHAGTLALLNITILDASYFGMTFGILLLGGLAAQFSAVGNRWIRAEPLATLGMIGNAIGLVLFAPPLMIAVFTLAFLILAVAQFALARYAFEKFGSLRCALAILMTFAAPVMYALSTADSPAMAVKIAAFTTYAPFPEGYFELRDALSAIALKAWKAAPWIGTGLGSFSLDIRFMATAEDWSLVSPAQVTALNGWWQLLVERGVIGAGMFAVALGLLLWTYVSRLVTAWSGIRITGEHLVGPLVLCVTVALAFFSCSYLRPEVTLLIGTFLAFSGGAFPERVKESGKEN